MTAGGSLGPIQRVARGDAGYPSALNDLERPPEAVYAIGRLELLADAARPAMAIVGTRGASPYGIRVARELARAVGLAGGIVVSGLARGIDAAAHEAVLDAGGDTVAVLGTGVDVPYPAGHRSLHERIGRAGLLLAEAEPGSKAIPGCFPRRNRLIAVLARCTVVVEAGYRSGALNTAGQADDIGRLVAAVPGPIDSPRSAGANLLLRDGAHVVSTIADAIGLAGLSSNATVTPDPVDAMDSAVWRTLEGGEMDADEIANITGSSIRATLISLARLEARGAVHDTGGGRMARAGAFDAAPGQLAAAGRAAPVLRRRGRKVANQCL